MTIPHHSDGSNPSFHSSTIALTSLSQDIPSSAKSEILRDRPQPTQWLEGISGEIIRDPDSHSRHSNRSGYSWDSLNHKWIRRSSMNLRRLITALAVILCQTSKSEDDIACAVEQYCSCRNSNSRGSGAITYVIRVARTGGVEQRFLDEFQALVDRSVEDMLKMDPEKLIPKSSKDCKAEIWGFEETLLLFIIQRCREKISNYNYKPLKKWAQKTFCSGKHETTTLSTEHEEWITATQNVPEELRTTCEGLFREMSQYAGSNELHHLGFFIEAISYMMTRLARVKSQNPEDDNSSYLEDKDRLPDVLERLDNIWKAAEESDLLDEMKDDIDDDHDHIEGFVASDAKRSITYRYLESLRRYSTASNRITAFLIQLHSKKKLRRGMIVVKMVEDFASISTKTEHQYRNLEDYIASFGEKHLRYHSMDQSQLSNIKRIWRQSYETKQFVHCEIQLMLSYALRPHLVPVSNFIGVSGMTCFLCSKAIKYFTRRNEGTGKLNIKATMAFAFAGTNGKMPTNWQFPDLFSRHERNVTGGLGDRAFKRCKDARCQCPNITCWGLVQLENWLRYFRTTLQNELRKATKAALKTVASRKDMEVDHSNTANIVKKRKWIPDEQMPEYRDTWTQV